VKFERDVKTAENDVKNKIKINIAKNIVVVLNFTTQNFGILPLNQLRIAIFKNLKYVGIFFYNAFKKICFTIDTQH